jgi:NAD(P)-dependent dehydrogenase (short-subunit alcohol dehydrogenase family)
VLSLIRAFCSPADGPANDLPICWTSRSPYRDRLPIVESLAQGNTIMNDTNNNLFRGLRIAITGGTSGLGLALVELLHERGAGVAFVARDADRVKAVAARLPGTHGIAGDVSSKSGTHPLAMQVTAALGGLDILINNASTLGPVPLAPLADTDCEDLEAALATNLVGPFRLTKALLGALAASARQGRPAIVVNISSDAAVNAYATWGAYGASKAAFAHMSRIWDEELREHGVRVMAIDPGDMDTPMHAQAIPDADRASLQRPRDAAARLLDRIASVAVSEKVAA